MKHYFLSACLTIIASDMISEFSNQHPVKFCIDYQNSKDFTVHIFNGSNFEKAILQTYDLVIYEEGKGHGVRFEIESVYKCRGGWPLRRHLPIMWRSDQDTHLDNHPQPESYRLIHTELSAVTDENHPKGLILITRWRDTHKDVIDVEVEIHGVVEDGDDLKRNVPINNDLYAMLTDFVHTDITADKQSKKTGPKLYYQFLLSVISGHLFEKEKNIVYKAPCHFIPKQLLDTVIERLGEEFKKNLNEYVAPPESHDEEIDEGESRNESRNEEDEVIRDYVDYYTVVSKLNREQFQPDQEKR